MSRFLSLSSLLVLGLLLLPAFAQADAASDEALKKTRALLVNPTERAAAIKGDSQAEEADSKAAAAGGSAANKQKIYETSADIFDKIAKDSGGNSEKIQETLGKAQNDPEAFFKSLPADQRAAIEKMARDIASKKGGGL